MGCPVQTHGPRSTWCEKRARLFALVILFKITWTVHRTVLQELYLSRVSKRAGKIPLDPSHQHTHSLNYYCLVDATKLWAPERPDTDTVSFPKQSISWTLDIKRGTHSTIIHYLFTTHTYFFISNLHMSDLTHKCLYWILCHFIHCLFVYLYIVLLLYIVLYIVSCPVTVLLFYCGASVTITNSSYV